MAGTMEENTGVIDDLLEKVTDYGKAELELVKLKALDKTSGLISASVPGIIVLILVSVFMLFLNLGLAIWAGGLLNNLFLGFFAVAALYGFIALIMHLFMRKWLKRKVGDYIISRVLK